MKKSNKLERKKIKESLKLTTFGFTLVELLAVIVILAIILVIAVPKVMDVIKDSKKATIESTAKLIAGTAEKVKLQNQILGNNKEINCEDIVKINDVDYESCSIEFDGNTAKVTLVGSGKFEGLNVCNGTKTNSSGVNISCSEVCDTNEEQKVYDYVKSIYYEVDDVPTCEMFIKEKFVEEIANNSSSFCEENASYLLGGTFNNLLEYSIKTGYLTEEELENYKVIVKPYEVEDIASCVSEFTKAMVIAGATDLQQMIEPLCHEETVSGWTFNSATNYIIEQGLLTEEELVENNVIKTKRVIKQKETEKVKICMPTKSMNGVTYLNKLVKDENARKAFGLIKDDTPDKNIRYAGFKPNNQVYFNCKEKDGHNISYGEENYNYEESCEIWRIIGVFNTKTTENGKAVARIKIVRDEPLSPVIEWDTTSDEIGYVNQWGETTLKDGTPYPGAKLKQYLNDGEDSYYASLTSIAKGQIEDALWYTGAVEEGTAREVYEDERSDTPGTDTRINYTTKWVGKIGLIYPSDFGYAGTNCEDKIIDNYVYGDSCGEKSNWLPSSRFYWTISSSNSFFASWSIFGGGYACSNNVTNEFYVRPSLYLSSNIQIIGGDGGTVPFKLSN